MWAALDAFLIASLGLLALLAFYAVLYQPIRSAVSNVPGIGGPLAGAVDFFFSNLSRLVAPLASATMGAFSQSLGSAAAAALGFFSSLADFAEAAFQADWRLLNQHLPSQIQQAIIHLEGGIGDARAYAAGLFAGVGAIVQAEVARVGDALGALIGQEAARAVNAEQAAVAEAGVLASQASDRAEQLFQQAEYDAGQAVALAEQKASDLFQQAEGDLNRVVGTIRGDLAKIADQVEAQLPEAIRNLNRDLDALNAQFQAQGPELQRNLDKEIADLKASAPWQLLTNLESEGENLLGSALADLVDVERRALHAEIAGAQALQTRLAPFVRAVTAQIRAR